LLLITAIFAATQSIFFQPLPLTLLSCLVYLGRSIPSFSRTSFTQSLHSLHNLCLHGIGRPLFFAGGKGGRPCLLFVCAFSSTGSPATPTRQCCAHSVLIVIYIVVKFSMTDHVLKYKIQEPAPR
jgi:hypothetical protein